MFSLIQQVFLILLDFSEFLTTKCVSLNEKPTMVRPTLINLNTVALKYRFMISLNESRRSCKVLLLEICVLKKAKHINVKVFNMIKV